MTRHQNSNSQLIRFPTDFEIGNMDPLACKIFRAGHNPTITSSEAQRVAKIFLRWRASKPINWDDLKYIDQLNKLKPVIRECDGNRT